MPTSTSTSTPKRRLACERPLLSPAYVYIAFTVVGVELLAISAIRCRYFKMSFQISALQVILGGALVFASGVLIGNA